MANESNKELTSVWTPANIVTCVRIVFIPVFMIVSALSHTSVAGTDWSTFDGPLAAAAFILYVILSCTDKVDGYLARSRNEITDFGKFLDPIADKLLVFSALLLFFDKVPLHVTRPVRWDSDHVVLFDDPTKEVAMEIAHIPGAWEKVIIGLDFFDASINRVGAWATGTRAMEKSLLYALLQPGERLKELQDTYQFTEKMMLAEQAKSMPFGAVWDEYCRRAGCPLDGELYPAVVAYEAKVLPERV